MTRLHSPSKITAVLCTAGPRDQHNQGLADTGCRFVVNTVGSYGLAVNAMLCKSCGSENLQKFRGEVAIHFPGLKNIDQPIVWVFPELVVCFDCGVAQFSVPEAELCQLQRGNAAGAG